jgi:transcriptional regulator with XRE-family HTH domain
MATKTPDEAQKPAGLVSLGAKLREVRRQRNLTMKQVASAADLTESFISQVERDSVNPSVGSLLKIAGVLGIHIADLFEPPAKPSGRVVRADQRSRLTYPGFGTTDALISPNLNGKLEVIWAESKPGESSGDQPYTHAGDEECIVVIKGMLEVWVGDEQYVLNAGDAITFESRMPHRWKAIGRGKMTGIWIVTPPSY